MRFYRSDVPSLVGIVIWLVIVIGSVYGYVMNIVKLVGLLDGPITGWFVARCVGVFAAPLGVVLGYL